MRGARLWHPASLSVSVPDSTVPVPSMESFAISLNCVLYLAQASEFQQPTRSIVTPFGHSNTTSSLIECLQYE